MRLARLLLCRLMFKVARAAATAAETMMMCGGDASGLLRTPIIS